MLLHAASNRQTDPSWCWQFNCSCMARGRPIKVAYAPRPINISTQLTVKPRPDCWPLGARLAVRTNFHRRTGPPPQQKRRGVIRSFDLISNFSLFAMSLACSFLAKHVAFACWHPTTATFFFSSTNVGLASSNKPTKTFSSSYSNWYSFAINGSLKCLHILCFQWLPVACLHPIHQRLYQTWNISQIWSNVWQHYPHIPSALDFVKWTRCVSFSLSVSNNTKKKHFKRKQDTHTQKKK